MEKKSGWFCVCVCALRNKSVRTKPSMACMCANKWVNKGLQCHAVQKKQKNWTQMFTETDSFLRVFVRISVRSVDVVFFCCLLCWFSWFLSWHSSFHKIWMINHITTELFALIFPKGIRNSSGGCSCCWLVGWLVFFSCQVGFAFYSLIAKIADEIGSETKTSNYIVINVIICSIRWTVSNLKATTVHQSLPIMR